MRVSLRQRLRSASPALYRFAARVYRPVLLARGALAALVWSPRPGTAPLRRSPAVALDGVAFRDPHTGIARLWRSVMEQWSASGFAEHITVLDRDGTAPQLPGFAYLRVPPLRASDSRMQRRMLERACGACGAEVFLSTLYTNPESTRLAAVVYDMTPNRQGVAEREPLWRERHRGIRRASALACISRATADDLARFEPGLVAPCEVIYPGLAEEFAPSSPGRVKAFRERMGLPETYYLFIGHRDDYKNAQLVFDAVSRLGPGPETGLLLIGGSPVLEPRFAARAGEMTVRLGRLGDAEMRDAYSGAAALLYVSKHEGFGLPVLEAMACGCPVIACDTPAVIEAGGDAAVYVGAADAGGLARAMTDVLEPARRAELVARGRARAARFSWGETAARLEELVLRAARHSSAGNAAN